MPPPSLTWLWLGSTAFDTSAKQRTRLRPTKGRVRFSSTMASPPVGPNKESGTTGTGPSGRRSFKKRCVSSQRMAGHHGWFQRWLQEMMGHHDCHWDIQAFRMQARYQSQYQEVQRWHLRQAPAVGTANLCETVEAKGLTPHSHLPLARPYAPWILRRHPDARTWPNPQSASAGAAHTYPVSWWAGILPMYLTHPWLAYLPTFGWFLW